MGAVKVKINTKEQNSDAYRPVAALLCFAAGVCGIFSLFGAMEMVDYSKWAVYAAAAVLCLLIWYTYNYIKKLFYLLCFLSFLGEALAAVMFGRSLLEQAEYVAGIFSGKRDMEQTPVTLLALAAVPLICFVFFFLEFILRQHMILYLITTGLMLLSPLLGVRAGGGTILLMAWFQIAFWVIYLTTPGRHKFVFSGVKSRYLSRKCSMAVGILLAAAFFLAALPVSFHVQELYGWAYEAEGQVYRMMNRLTGKAQAPVTGGAISRGNNYFTGTAQLELTASERPSEALYLKGFGGGEYVGGDWVRSSDEELFENMEDTLQWGEWSSIIPGMYYRMYYVLNANLHKSGRPEDISLDIRHSSGQYENSYAPYYGQYNSGYETRNGGYAYLYYEQKDMALDWNNVLDNFDMAAGWYKEIQDAYLVEARIAYTQVPTELLPRLTKLCRENPLEGLDEITAFILYTLRSNASYSLTPGWAPMNEDIVEYFLFENHRGYCQHFATAATLMYRLYGVPARYATGYMVKPSAFMLQKDGTYQAIATDENAHAWVEIFLEDYGWTPVEVTPDGAGAGLVSYPGFDNSVLEQVIREQGWEQKLPAENQTQSEGAQSADDLGKRTDEAIDFKIDLNKYENWIYSLGSCGIYTLILAPFFLDYRRLKRLRKMEREGCRRTYGRFIQMLHFCGILLNYNGEEEDFAQRTAAEIPEVSEEEMARMQEIVSRAAYSSRPPMPEEEDFVQRLYVKTAETVQRRLKRHRKLIFRYWRTFV
nr:transglutaminase domain-containing protein [uncultured Acetatifactor sp.]